jgi:hypothetical protein
MVCSLTVDTPKHDIIDIVYQIIVHCCDWVFATVIFTLLLFLLGVESLSERPTRWVFFIASGAMA